MKPDVLLLKAILPDTIRALEEHFTLHRLDQAADRSAFIAAVGHDIRAVVVGGQAPATSELFAQLPRLEIVANFGVGYDTIDVAAAQQRRIIVTNTPDVLTEEVADLALGLLLAVVRRIPQADRYLRSGAWTGASFPLTASLRGVASASSASVVSAKPLPAASTDLVCRSPIIPGRAAPTSLTPTATASLSWHRQPTCSL